MTLRPLTPALLAVAVCLGGAGCHPPGKPGLEAEAARPNDVLDFPTLYKQNCAACHGANGKNGAAISLANPVYLAVAGTGNLQRITASGVPGTAMPPFGRASGGMLTDSQIVVLSKGMVDAWGRPDLNLDHPPAYAGSTAGDPTRGQAAFATFCARCHGNDGTGIDANTTAQTGSIVDPAYLALVSDQGLRSIVIAGQPEQGMPDWRSDLPGAAARPMTNQEITDTVAWIASHRISTPGQPYPQHP